MIDSESYEEFVNTLQKEILESLSRETKITEKILSQITLINKSGDKLKIDKKLAKTLVNDWKQRGYIGDDEFISSKAIKDFKNNDFEILPQFIGFENELKELVKKASSSAVVNNMINNAKKTNEMTLTPNQNFEKKEFQELWNKINKKARYQINVDSEDLKIQYAKKYFESLSDENIIYDCVKDYKELVNKILR